MSNDADLAEEFDTDELPPEEIRELKRRMKDMEDPIRYVVTNGLFYRIRSKRTKSNTLFFNVSDDTWCSEIERATCFKRKEYAEAIAKVLDDGGDDKSLITKITTKGGRRKVLKYRA